MSKRPEYFMVQTTDAGLLELVTRTAYDAIARLSRIIIIRDHSLPNLRHCHELLDILACAVNSASARIEELIKVNESQSVSCSTCKRGITRTLAEACPDKPETCTRYEERK